MLEEEQLRSEYAEGYLYQRRDAAHKPVHLLFLLAKQDCSFPLAVGKCAMALEQARTSTASIHPCYTLATPTTLATLATPTTLATPCMTSLLRDRLCFLTSCTPSKKGERSQKGQLIQ